MTPARQLPLAIPDPGDGLTHNLRAFCDAVRLNLQVFAGMSGVRDKWLLTRQDLVDASVIGHDSDGRLVPVITVRDTRKATTTATGMTTTDLLMTGLRVGVFAVPNGAASVTVTGLGLAIAPTRVWCGTLIKPAASGVGSLQIFAVPVETTFTADGFTASLSGHTDAAGYKLPYITMD